MSIPGELIPKAGVWLEPGITPCVKTPTVAARVETSRRNCIPESQIILHTRGVMPSWRIVFSTFRRCMSFYTARVITGKARREHKISALATKSGHMPRGRLGTNCCHMHAAKQDLCSITSAVLASSERPSARRKPAYPRLPLSLSTRSIRFCATTSSRRSRHLRVCLKYLKSGGA